MAVQRLRPPPHPQNARDPPNPPRLLVNSGCLEGGDAFLRLLDEALETCPQRLLGLFSSCEARAGRLSEGRGRERAGPPGPTCRGPSSAPSPRAPLTCNGGQQRQKGRQ